LTTAFVDTGAWIALMVQKDAYHVPAREFFRSIARSTRLVTSNFVMSETLTWLAYHGLRREALRFKDMVDASEQVRRLNMAWVTPEVHEYAYRIFANFDDQDFSFCDCTSFILARQKAVDFVFGFDHHFASLGFDLRPR
jgi:predicted nucleic acid-binding protein